jgi:ribosomal protein S18 acetylase RimI-like enzyme
MQLVPVILRKDTEMFEKPFERDGDAWNQNYWEGPAEELMIYISFEDPTGSEVARAELDEEPVPNLAGYPDLRDSYDTITEIAFIEVHPECRRRGVGRQVVEIIAEEVAPKRLFAFSADADADTFWAGLGWARSENLFGPEDGSPLYTQVWLFAE